MVKDKNRGTRANTRASTRKSPRTKGMPNVNKYVQEFEIGQKVHIKIDSSVHEGMPFKRFWGKTGIVLGKQGKSYLVEASDMGAKKQVIIHPVHLKAQK